MTATAPITSVLDWAPLPGPQKLALECNADVIGFGGAAGGGKTDLALGMAARHYRSIIFRRVFPSLRGIIERSREIFARDISQHAKDSYNEQLHLWRLADGRVIEFGAVQYEADRRKHQGQARDFMAFDEVTEFPESIVRFVMAWNRTTRTDVQPQTLMTFNPPTDAAGRWVLRYFGPWLDPLYRGKRAQPGELRYFTTIDGADTEVPPGTSGAKSRTFIPAVLADNPYLAATGYGDTIDALPEPLRSILKGDFSAGQDDDPWKVIPFAWVQLAMARWHSDDRRGRVTSAGLDVARGGRDRSVVARLYGTWLEPLQEVAGKATPDGPTAAALVLGDAMAGTIVGVDVIGVGASAYDSLAAYDLPNVVAVNNSAAAQDWRGESFTDHTGKLRFRNVRALAYWRLREALDPNGPDPIALPNDPTLAEELTTPRWSLTSSGIQVEAKDDIIARVGHSPDRADALAVAIVAPLLLPVPVSIPRIESHKPNVWSQL